jgi:hypothetical protein
VDWDGTVIVLGEIRKGVGNARINGGLIVGETSDYVEFAGTSDLTYSKEAVDRSMLLTAPYSKSNGWQEPPRNP